MPRWTEIKKKNPAEGEGQGERARTAQFKGEFLRCPAKKELKGGERGASGLWTGRKGKKITNTLGKGSWKGGNAALLAARGGAYS